MSGISSTVTHALLDGSVTSDSLAGTVVRGDTIVGNSTPKWGRIAIGSAGKTWRSDGTDPSWQYPSLEVALSDGATPALDASLGNVFRLSAAGNRTIAVPTNAHAGQKIIIQHYASGGARTLALNTGAGGFRFGTDITALTATSSGKTDYIGAIYNNGASFWDVVGYSKGY